MNGIITNGLGDSDTLITQGYGGWWLRILREVIRRVSAIHTQIVARSRIGNH